MLLNIIQVLFIALGPYLLIRYEKKVKLIDYLSPVVCCYILGIILGNLPFWSMNTKISTTFTELTVPIAIPLLLFSTNFLTWLRLAKKTILSFVLILISVMLTTYFVTLEYADQTSEFWKIGGMLVGVYTGGTPNMNAIGLSLGVSKEAYVLLNAADLMAGGIYLLFIFTIGVKIYEKFLPAFKSTGAEDVDEAELMNSWAKLSNAQKTKNAIILFFSGAAGLGIAAGLSILLFGKMEVAFIILLITTFGIGFSFLDFAKRCKGSYEVGNYLLLMFCVAIGSLASIENMVSGSIMYLKICGTVMFIAISAHLILCKVFKIDAHTALITSVAGIFGPPFVAPIASILKNREILVSGLTSGLVGYAVGNYLGIGLAQLLKP